MDHSLFSNKNLIGDGVDSKVYKFTHSGDPNVSIAVKAFNEYSSRYKREAHMMKILTSSPCENIVSMLGQFGRVKGCYILPCISMECAKCSLAEILRDNYLEYSEAKYYLRDAAAGLKHLHSLGFIHGDIKPENMLVFPIDEHNFMIKLSDFGTSRRPETITNARMGTQFYQAPESIMGIEYGYKSDVFSLLAVFFEAATGRILVDIYGNSKTYEGVTKITYTSEYEEDTESTCSCEDSSCEDSSNDCSNDCCDNDISLRSDNNEIIDKDRKNNDHEISNGSNDDNIDIDNANKHDAPSRSQVQPDAEAINFRQLNIMQMILGPLTAAERPRCKAYFDKYGNLICGPLNYAGLDLIVDHHFPQNEDPKNKVEFLELLNMGIKWSQAERKNIKKVHKSISDILCKDI